MASILFLGESLHHAPTKLCYTIHLSLRIASQRNVQSDGGCILGPAVSSNCVLQWPGSTFTATASQHSKIDAPQETSSWLIEPGRHFTHSYVHTTSITMLQPRFHSSAIC